MMLFTRDLRVNDNPALARAAAENEQLLALFVLDDALLAGAAGAPGRVRFLLDCLADLADGLRSLGGRLVVRRGDPVREAIALAVEHSIQAIYLSDDYTPFARRRLARLEDAAQSERIAVHRLPGVALLEPGAVLPAGGESYRVFSPYFRAWSEQPLREASPPPV